MKGKTVQDKKTREDEGGETRQEDKRRLKEERRDKKTREDERGETRQEDKRR